MKTKELISLSAAIDEAIRFGFRTRYTLKENKIHSILSDAEYDENEYAVVKSYPVKISANTKGLINYVVLNNGNLGFFLSRSRMYKRHKKTEPEELEPVETVIENIYSA